MAGLVVRLADHASTPAVCLEMTPVGRRTLAESATNYS
jgi:hypothetical protein